MTRSFSIAALLQWACQILAQQDSPQREAEILLSYVLLRCGLYGISLKA